MNCNECIEALLVADLRTANSSAALFESSDFRTEDAETHLVSCVQCARAAELLRTAEYALSESLVIGPSRHTADSLAEFAHQRVRRGRLVNRVVFPAIILAFLLGAFALVKSEGSSLARMIEPPPSVETETFSLTCLSGEQAAALLRPYLPTPQNPMWQAERFDVSPVGGGIRAVTMRAPGITLALVPRLLERFERDPQAACRVQKPAP